MRWWKNFDNKLSCFNTMLARDIQMDRWTHFNSKNCLCLAWCWHKLCILHSRVYTWCFCLHWLMLRAVIGITVTLWLTWSWTWSSSNHITTVRFLTSNAVADVISDWQWYAVNWQPEYADGQHETCLCDMWWSCIGQALWCLQVDTLPVEL